MSRVFAANTDHLDSSSTIITDVPMTFSAWYKLTSSQSGSIMQAVWIGISGGIDNSFAMAVHTNTEIQERDTVTSTQASVTGISSFEQGSWHLITAVFSTHSSRSAYLDGGGKSTSVTARTAAGLNAIRISGDLNATPTQFFKGRLAHIGIWNTALTDPQVNSLLYRQPNQVAVANLVNYWPLTGNQSPEPDYGSGNLPLTVTGTTFSTDNPNIAGTLNLQLMGGSAA